MPAPTPENGAEDDESGDEPDSKYTGNPEGKRFTKLDGAEYDRVADFMDGRVRFTPREWAIARLCQDFRTETGVEMTTIGENLPDLVPFMTDTYSAQSVNSAKTAFDDKVQLAASTFLYGALCGFYTADELDEILYEATETAKFMLEVEGVAVDVEHEIDVEERIADAMQEVRQTSREIRAELDQDESES